jgi:ABC-type glycerol-3-phosphate transport system substrate-binding protein
MFKKLYSVMMIALMLVGVVACSSQDTSSENTTEEKPETKNSGQVKVDNPWDQMELGASGPVEIDFWHIQATIYGEAVHEIVEQFNEEYEGKIKVNETFQGMYDELNKKIGASLAGGGLPNVSMAYESDTLEYMKADQVKELDEFISSEKYGYTEEGLSDINEGVLARQQIPQYDGKTMSWIHGNSSMGTYYNKDILSEAGIDKPAETWKEFEQQALDIYEKTGVPALAVNPNGLGGNFGIWLRTYGIEPLALDGSMVDYGNEHAVELLGIIKNLVDKGAIYYAEDTEQEFTNGRAAMEISTTARSSTKIELIQDTIDWGIALIPQGDLNKKSTGLWGGNHIMFKSTPEKELASWVFMKYFASAKAQAIYASKTGYFPAVKSALDTELLSENFAANPQKLDAFENVFPFARITAPSAASRPINDAVSEAISGALNNTISVEDAVKKMHQDAEGALMQYQ